MIIVRQHGVGWVAGRPYIRTRRGEPQIEVRDPHFAASPESALRAALGSNDRVGVETGATSERRRGTREDAKSTVPDARFDGDDYDDVRDRPRLGRQLRAVYRVMRDGGWHTIREVAREVDWPDQSVARQIRYLRAERFGGHTVDREYVGDGLYRYRLIEKEVANGS